MAHLICYTKSKARVSPSGTRPISGIGTGHFDYVSRMILTLHHGQRWFANVGSKANVKKIRAHTHV